MFHKIGTFPRHEIYGNLYIFHNSPNLFVIEALAHDSGKRAHRGALCRATPCNPNTIDPRWNYPRIYRKLLPNGGRGEGEATGNVYFFTGIIREGQIRKRGQNLFVAILFNSRGIDRSVERGREGGRGIVCSLYLLGSNRPVSISRSGALRSILRGRGGRGSVGSIVKKEGMGFQE